MKEYSSSHRIVQGISGGSVLTDTRLSILVLVLSEVSGGIRLSDGRRGCGMQKPVVVYLRTFLRYATDHDCSDIRRPEGVVVNEHEVSGDVCAVVAISTPVHVETVTVGVLQDYVEPGLVTGARPACAGNVVTAPIEQIGLDKCIRLIEYHTISQAVPLVVVHKMTHPCHISPNGGRDKIEESGPMLCRIKG